MWWDWLFPSRARERAALRALAEAVSALRWKARRLHAALPSYIYRYDDKELLYMAADLTAMTGELEQIGAVLDATLAFVNGVPAKTQAAVDAALAGSASPEQIAGVQARVDALSAKANDVGAALARQPA